MSASYPTSVPRRAWIAFDTTQQPPLAVAAWRRAGTLRTVPLAAAAAVRQRPAGRRTLLALPMQRIFCEYCEPPARSRRQAERLAPGLLDLRLPLPIERCAVALLPALAADGSNSKTALLAYAAPTTLLAELGSTPEQPDGELLVPAAVPLWQMALEQAATRPDEIQMVLHATRDAWCLLIGRGRLLQHVLALPVDDHTGLGRNLQLFMQRWESRRSRLHLTGPGANEALRQQLQASPALAECSITLAPEPATALAATLARMAATGRHLADLRPAWRPHPAAERRQALRRAALLGLTAAAALLLPAFNLVQLLETRAAVAECDRALTAASQTLAGRPLPGSGAANIELARNELAGRLNPAIEAFVEPPLLTHLPDLLHVASLRGITLARVAVSGARIELSGSASSEADVAVLRETARRRGLLPALEVTPGSGSRTAFHGTLMRQEALP